MQQEAGIDAGSGSRGMGRYQESFNENLSKHDKIKVGYLAIIYNSACRIQLHRVNDIANKALRIAKGSFQSTPVDALQVLANEKPLNVRRDETFLRHCFIFFCYNH